jgi:hypothetical protein
MTKLAVFAYFPLQSMEPFFLPLSFNSSHSRNNNTCKEFFYILPQPHSEPRMLKANTSYLCAAKQNNAWGW